MVLPFDGGLEGGTLSARIDAVSLQLSAALGKRSGNLLATMDTRPNASEAWRRCRCMDAKAEGKYQRGYEVDSFHGMVFVKLTIPL